MNKVFLKIVVCFSFLIILLIFIVDVEAEEDGNLNGYAWSDAIGWVSFNYGTNIDYDGYISGYAWSDALGWISFNASDLVGCPTIPCSARFDRDSRNISGWAKDLGSSNPWILLGPINFDGNTILASDWIVDFGPGAGKNGGQIMYCGEVKELLKNNKSKSLTGKYLRREEVIDIPQRRKIDSRYLKVIGASENNLKNINVNIPLGKLVCLTGVSGSGKSTLMNNVIYDYITGKLNHFKRDIKVKEIKNIEYIDRIIKMDQSMIGKSPRSNPATYTKAYDEIRNLFAMTPEARMKGYKPGRFSFNVSGGRCENCQGRGTMEIEMHFLPNVEVVCDFCKGKRFNKETLAVHYKGKNIAEVLEMTIEEAEKFFRDIPLINDKLKVLSDVGLGYLTLGQSATTLSGGESQRIKLSRELSKRSKGKTLYLLDEPTTGLHYEDIKKLILVLQKLVNMGNTVMVIEHNLDFIKCADWIIDLGEDGGDKGGKIVGEGTPEEIARLPSWTGLYLRKIINEKLERKN
jgi:excinuclease ABC subunit A